MKLIPFKWRYLKLYCNIKVIMGLIPAILIANVFLYVIFFSKSSVKIISLQELPSQLVPVPINESLVNGTKIEYCDIMTLVIDGLIITVNPTDTISDSLLDTVASKLKVQPGGWWQPSNCVSRHHVALVIPYRKREEQLKVFLAYMHPFLQAQNLNYRIFIIEQTDRRPFNRGKLFNIGFKEAEKFSNFPCFIFHDVDLLPLNINNVYGCTKLPRHMSANIDIFNYQVPYEYIIGGAVAITKDQFNKVNGFSNTFFGWGGEDDDFYKRVTHNGTKISRFSASLSKYIMLKHKKEVPSRDRFYFLQNGDQRFTTDGLNSLRYSVLSSDILPLYTRILVDL